MHQIYVSDPSFPSQAVPAAGIQGIYAVSVPIPLVAEHHTYLIHAGGFIFPAAAADDNKFKILMAGIWLSFFGDSVDDWLWNMTLDANWNYDPASNLRYGGPPLPAAGLAVAAVLGDHFALRGNMFIGLPKAPTMFTVTLGADVLNTDGAAVRHIGGMVAAMIEASDRPGDGLIKS